jgi:UDP-glucose 4-epimerase
LQNEKTDLLCEVFNLGSGNGVTVLEAIHSFEKVSGVKLNYEIGPRRSGDVVAIYANNDLAKRVLKWETKYSLDDMMATSWKWEQRLKADDKIFTNQPKELN